MSPRTDGRRRPRPSIRPTRGEAGRIRAGRRSAAAGPGTSVTAALLAMLALGCGNGDAPPPSGTGGEGDFESPLDADVLLAELHRESSGPPGIGAPTNLTHRVDYDNQPQFLPDGSGLWYTAVDPQAGQADVYRYDLASGTVARVTMSSPESEYSATPLPDGSGISAVRVEADSTQRLWRFDPDGSNAAVLLEDVAPVGYHAWIDANTVALFVLGDPATLQVADLRTGDSRIVAEDIGRSIQPIPGTSAAGTSDVSYVQRHEDGTSTIMRLPGGDGDPTPIIETVDGGDFHAWSPDGTLLMAGGAVVYAAVEADVRAWTPVADFSNLGISISRLAVSPDGSQIAMVAEPTPMNLPTN